MSYFKETKKLIDQELKQTLKSELNKYKNNQIIKTNIQDFIRLSKGGKRVRGILVRIGSELTDKKVNYLPVSAAAEILQTASLIHDDVIDNSALRRHEITINAKYPELGIPKAICMGDYGFFLSYQIIGESKLKISVKQKINEIITKIMLNAVIGELLDVELPTKNPTKKELTSIYINKTAWYTIIGPLLMGASLNKLSKRLESDIINFGLNLGIAFQIKDDIISIMSNNNDKSNNSDIIEGKVTELYLYTKAKTPEKLKYYGQKDITKSQINTIKKTFINNGAIDYAEEQVLIYSNQALNILNEMKINKNTKEKLKEIVKFLIDRTN